MSVDINTEIVIGAPCDVVARYAKDPDNAPTWYVNIKSVEWLTTRPLRLGSRIAFVAYFLGRRMAYTYEIAELVPERRLVMRTAQGPFPMETTYEFEPLAARSTRMRLRNRGEPAGFSKLLAPLLSVAMRRANRKDLAVLKRLLESRPME
ncbi:MAG: SRPBCC family protein [Gemmatimonadota bacterium]|nr:SRPBCC family protein [Gemmatimonadota bacterium]